MSHFTAVFDHRLYVIPDNLYSEYIKDLREIKTPIDNHIFRAIYKQYEVFLSNNATISNFNPLSFSLNPKAIEIEGFENITISDGTQYNQEDPNTKEDIFYYFTKRNFEHTKVEINQDNNRIELNLSRETLKNLIQIFQSIEKIME